QAGGGGSAAKSGEIDWERFFSVEYFRYAGLLLIVSAIFAFLFRIEWSLTAKIIAAFSGAVASIALAEYALRQEKTRIAGVCFLGAFALTHFGFTLLYKHFTLGNPGALANVETWVAIKTCLSIAGCFALGRYRA